ncbi:MAG: VanZ family protein [Candidatus Sumerlaeia bacterium]|nr:VanZ family protein [Candidatus Sumerlaeia bacterium]
MAFHRAIRSVEKEVFTAGSSPRERFMRLWLPVLAWAALIMGLTSIPGTALPKAPFSHFDLLVHAGLYAVLGFFLQRLAVLARPDNPTCTFWPVIYVVGQLYGILDEVHQLWIPFRSFAWTDAAADGGGVLLGIAVFCAWRKWAG